ncbi:MAG: hypothetical protein P8M18_12105 [Woeseiaceae bacterium]|nr:hypothetical protein [Woeseiaceae bacterium]
MTDNWKLIARRESVLFLWILLGGLILLPVAVYIVGRLIFGEYGGTGFMAFYGMLYSELLSGAPSVWFLVLSPYLIWQLLRLTLRAFKIASGR